MGGNPVIISYPLFRLALSLAAGIFLSGMFLTDSDCMAALLSGFFFCLLLAAMLFRTGAYRWRFLFGIAVYLSFAFLGAALMQWRCSEVRYDWPGEERTYVGILEDLPHDKPKTKQAIVTVVAVKDTLKGKWCAVGRKIQLYWMPDSLQPLPGCGDKVCFQARISRPVSDVDFTGFDYAAYLERQGISGTAVAFSGKWQFLAKAEEWTFRQKALLVRDRIVRVYRGWGLGGDVLAVVSALTVGDKSELTRELKATYSAAGASHVLALSGLHIGILAMILSWLLRPFHRFRGGKQAVACCVVALLWAFAFLTGLSPSVIRAVTMFSFYAVASICSENRYSGFHALSLAAFLMLLYQPMYLFDISFQLSFVAVLSILLFYPLLKKMLPVRHPLLKYVCSVLFISVAAQLGTLPFILYYFGTFPTYFLLANLVVAPLSVCILASALSALCFSSVPYAGEFLAGMLEHSASMLNATMKWVQHLEGSQLTSVYFTAFQSFLFAVALLLFHRYLFLKSARVLMQTLACFALLFGSFIYDRVQGSDDYLYLARSAVYTKRGNTVSRLYHSGGIYRVGSCRIGLMNTARWKDKEAEVRLPLDFVYVCRGFKGSMRDLLRSFQVGKVVFDVSLSDRYREALERECRELGIPCVTMPDKGSYAVLL